MVMSESADAGPDYYEECTECGEEVGEADKVEHPAYEPTFCSRSCLNRYLNKVQGY